MGSQFIKPPKIQPTGLNFEARALSAPAYAGRIAGGKAEKDIAAAQAIYKAGSLKPTMKDAASDAPGPKKV